MIDENPREWGEVYVLGRPHPLLTIMSGRKKVSFQNYCEEKTLVLDERREDQYSSLTDSFLSQALVPYIPSAIKINLLKTRENLLPAISYPTQRVIDYIDNEEEVIVTPRNYRTITRVLLVGFLLFAGWGLSRLISEAIIHKHEIVHVLGLEYIFEQYDNEGWSSSLQLVRLQRADSGAIDAQMFWDPENHHGLFYLKNLPQTSPEQAFQLWFCTRDKQIISGSVFRAESGIASVKIKYPSDLGEKIERVVISLEPQGGSQFPNGPILLKGTLQ